MTGELKEMESTLPGIVYVPNLLSPEEQSTLFERLKELDFQHGAYGSNARQRDFEGPQQQMVRGYYQFGHAYSFNGSKLESAEPIPEFLLAVRERGVPHCPPGLDFNMCAIMRYPTGTCLGWHVDGERFGECVMGFSLGGQSTMQFRKDDSSEVCYQLPLEKGSMYALSGIVRWEFQHQLLTVEEERIAITFRCIGG